MVAFFTWPFFICYNPGSALAWQLEFAFVTLGIADVIRRWRVLLSINQIFFDVSPLKNRRRRNGVPQNSRLLYTGVSRLRPLSTWSSTSSHPFFKNILPHLYLYPLHTRPPRRPYMFTNMCLPGTQSNCCPLHHLSAERGQVQDWVRVRVVHRKLASLRITVARS